jgi:tetratricopeptide (TPR) repeat protein
MSYELTNQPAQAATQFKLLLPWVRKGYDYDEFAERKAKRYATLKGGLSAFEKHYHVCMLHYEACRWDETLKSVAEIEPTVHGEEEKARLSWLKGAVLQKLDKLNEAKTLFQDVVASEKVVKDKDSLFLIPHSLCGLGEILMSEKQWDAAERTLKKAKTYNSYDFSQLLGWRIKKDLENIKKAKAGKL